MRYFIPRLVQFEELLIIRKDLFLTFVILKIRNFPYVILSVFLDKLYHNFCFFY